MEFKTKLDRLIKGATSSTVDQVLYRGVVNKALGITKTETHVRANADISMARDLFNGLARFASNEGYVFKLTQSEGTFGPGAKVGANPFSRLVVSLVNRISEENIGTPGITYDIISMIWLQALTAAVAWELGKGEGAQALGAPL